MSEDPLIKIVNLKKYFPIKEGVLARNLNNVKAVDDISFDIKKGEIFGLVGESGCGKTTTGRLAVGATSPSSGKIMFEVKDINDLPNKELRVLRKKIGVVFQDPYTSLDPRMRVKNIIREPLDIHDTHSRKERDEKVEKLLEDVRLDRALLDRYPYDISGGEKQRVCIARALINNPTFLLADEPVSSIDVSIRSQILNLLKDLIEEFRLTSLFISHDLSVVEYMSDRVGVMYLGKLVEVGPVKEIFENPVHPYTVALIEAIPIPGERSKERTILKGTVPSAVDPPKGCRFHTRCKICEECCTQEEPQLVEIRPEHYVSCHLCME